MKVELVKLKNEPRHIPNRLYPLLKDVRETRQRYIIFKEYFCFGWSLDKSLFEEGGSLYGYPDTIADTYSYAWCVSPEEVEAVGKIEVN